MSCSELQKVLETNNKENCFSESTSAMENGKKFSFENKSKKSVCRAKIDHCLITSIEVKKCDFLFMVKENNKYYLVELKGTRAIEAAQQIISTYKIVNLKINTIPENYKGIIVSSSVPAGTEQRFRQMQSKWYRDYRLRITKTHFHHTEKI